MKLKITKKEKQALKKVFENFGRTKTEEEIFYDLVFCLLAPQTTFKSNVKVTNELKKLDFYHAPLPVSGRRMSKNWYTKNLPEILKPVRFYRNKAKYLIEAKKKFPEIFVKVMVKDAYYLQKEESEEAKIIREWLVKNVKGLGMKTASHFLRNLGEENLAVIDVHICKFLADRICTHSLNKKEDIKKLVKEAGTRKGYLRLENEFCRIAKENKVSPAMLDAYLWKIYSGTAWEEFKF